SSIPSSSRLGSKTLTAAQQAAPTSTQRRTPNDAPGARRSDSSATIGLAARDSMRPLRLRGRRKSAGPVRLHEQAAIRSGPREGGRHRRSRADPQRATVLLPRREPARAADPPDHAVRRAGVPGRVGIPLCLFGAHLVGRDAKQAATAARSLLRRVHRGAGVLVRVRREGRWPGRAARGPGAGFLVRAVLLRPPSGPLRARRARPLAASSGPIASGDGGWNRGPVGLLGLPDATPVLGGSESIPLAGLLSRGVGARDA